MVEHADIPNIGLHEPKDINSATSGQVYTADGTLSGVWADQEYPRNEVIVESQSDFGTVVAGSITLAAATVYKIAGSVTCSDKLIMSAGTVLQGQSSRVSALTYTGTGDFITNVGNSIELECIKFNCPSQASGDVVLNTSTPSGVVINNLQGITVVNCGGFIKSDGVTIVLDTAFIEAHSGDCFEAVGTLSPVTWGITNVVTVGTQASSVGVELGSSVILSMLIDNVSFNGPGIGISGLTASGNIETGTLATVDRTNFLGVTTPLVNIDPQDDQWIFMQSSGVDASRVAAQGSIEGSALNTSFSGTGVGNEVKVNFGTAFVADIQDKITIDNTGRFTYTGEDTRTLYFSTEFFGTISGGAARDYLFCINENGTLILSSANKGRYDGSNPGSLSMSSVITLSKNDWVEFWVRAETATTSLNIDTASIKVLGGV